MSQCGLPRCLQNQRVDSASSDSPLQRIKEISRYGISVSTPNRRYGHRLRTLFLRTPFPRRYMGGPFPLLGHCFPLQGYLFPFRASFNCFIVGFGPGAFNCQGFGVSLIGFFKARPVQFGALPAAAEQLFTKPRSRRKIEPNFEALSWFFLKEKPQNSHEPGGLVNSLISGTPKM